MINVDIEAYQRDLQSSWLWKIWTFLVDNWIPVLVIIVVFVVARLVVHEDYTNEMFVYSSWTTSEQWYGWENTLAAMKAVLEEDYSDCWHDSKFCLAYLALQDEQQRLCRLAKSNSKGENPQRFHWANRYAKINIK